MIVSEAMVPQEMLRNTGSSGGWAWDMTREQSRMKTG